MKNKGIWLVMVSIVAAGILITMCTSLFITKSQESAVNTLSGTLAEDAVSTTAVLEEPYSARNFNEQIPESEILAEAEASVEGLPESVVTGGIVQPETVLSPLETAESSLTEEANESDLFSIAASGNESGSRYISRLGELDVQIQRIRDEETESTTYSMKTAAENELKLWDSELNLIYNDLLDSMNEERDLELIEEQREWMKTRDATAVEAAKNSAGGTLEGLEYTASLASSTRQRAYELAEMYEDIRD